MGKTSFGEPEYFKSEEYRKTVQKGRQWLAEYLYAISKNKLSDRVRKRLVSVLSDIYKTRMAEDEAFFNSVKAFVSERRTTAEKEVFFETMTSYIVTNIGVKELYAKRYPEDFTHR